MKTASVTSSNDGIGKGTLEIPESIKRELYNEQGSSDNPKTKKMKHNNDNDGNEEWINVGRLEFYLEIPRGSSESNLINELKQHKKKMSVTPHDDSYNMCAIRVGVPGRRYTTIWKYGGDKFITKFLIYSCPSLRTKCDASFPDTIEVLDDPKRKTYWLVPIYIHFYLHKEIDLFNHPDKNVKRQVKQLINYMRGGAQPNPARYSWPNVTEEIANECIENANLMDRLMKKKTAKEWWKGGGKK